MCSEHRHPLWIQEAWLAPCWAKFSCLVQDKLPLWASVSASMLTLQGGCEGHQSGLLSTPTPPEFMSNQNRRTPLKIRTLAK